MADYHVWNPLPPLWALQDIVFDVAIYGAGYTGFGAARSLVAQGKKVLLIDRRPAPLHESSWAFHQETGHEPLPDWQQWLSEAESHSLARNGQVVGSGAEILATRWLLEAKKQGSLATLYYAAPAGVEMEGDQLVRLWLACKARFAPVRALRWLDASQERELAAAVARSAGGMVAPATGRVEVNICFRNHYWNSAPWDHGTSLIGALPGLDVTLLHGAWPTEAVIRVTEAPAGSDSGEAGHLRAFRQWSRSCWVPALKAVREVYGAALEGAIVTNGSVLPWREWVDCGIQSPAANLAAVQLGTHGDTLAGRFSAGAAAANGILDIPAGPAAGNSSKTPPDWRDFPLSRTIIADISVCGMGTGGALAGISAGQAASGKSVVGFEALPFCGGIASGGGIHHYYFGVRGGLQEDIDSDLRAVGDLFGPQRQIRGSHPDARKWVLENRVRRTGAELLFEATLVAADYHDGVVKSALVSTPEGLVKIQSSSWIDSTGDGDLSALAGARFTWGRDGDGLLHAYSQSSGKVDITSESTHLHVVNYDAGFVDPTDPVDLTRGRQQGVNHYLQDSYTPDTCPSYIAPAIGLRQSRQFETDYVLTFGDQVRRRAFPDAVGLTGCHFDNHATDYDLESQEAMFLTWVCRAYRDMIGGQIPYRIMLPVGLQNVWLACRAVGVTQDAHHAFRLQRDMQRLGEVAGIAAHLAPGGDSRKVPFGELRRALVQSGALRPEFDEENHYGHAAPATQMIQPARQTPASEALEALRSGKDSFVMWDLYELGAAGPCAHVVREGVGALLDHTDPDIAFRAAAIMAMWGQAEAEPVLLKTLGRYREEFDPNNTSDLHNRRVPYWLCSLSLLRVVATPKVLGALADFATEAPRSLNIWIPLAQCVAGIAERHTLAESEKAQAMALLDYLAATPVVNAFAPPQHAPLVLDHGSPEPLPGGRRPVREDLQWQLDLWLLKSNRVLGRTYDQGLQRGLADERALVRMAFAPFAAA